MLDVDRVQLAAFEALLVFKHWLMWIWAVTIDAYAE